MLYIPKIILRGALPVLLCGALGGCDLADRLLSVETAGQLLDTDYLVPANAQLMVNSAISDFECAFASYAFFGGATGEELEDANLGVTNKGYDQRQATASGPQDFATGGCGSGIYIPLSTARAHADHALTLLDGWSDTEVANRTLLLATAAAYSGYSYLLIGEAMCSAAFDAGPEVQRQGVFELAEERFTRAIQETEAAGPAAASILNMAYVGRARTRLNLGDVQAAASDARNVPEGFVRNATYSDAASRRNNYFFTQNVRGNNWTVGELYRDVRYLGVPDPRVRVTNTGRNGSDAVTPLWQQHKYTTATSPIPIARWAEAQLIIAEAELEAGNTAAAVAVINHLHRRAGIPEFSSTNAAEVREHLIEERRRELFLESHHFFDMVRYERPFRPLAGTPYPPKAGGFYGTMTCFPLPEVETANNPNF